MEGLGQIALGHQGQRLRQPAQFGQIDRHFAAPCLRLLTHPASGQAIGEGEAAIDRICLAEARPFGLRDFRLHISSGVGTHGHITTQQRLIGAVGRLTLAGHAQAHLVAQPGRSPATNGITADVANRRSIFIARHQHRHIAAASILPHQIAVSRRRGQRAE